MRALGSIRVAVILCGVGSLAENSEAVLHSAVSASTNMGSGFTTNLVNTINGVGLSSLSLTATHAGTLPTNSWVSLAPTLTGQVTFDLGGLQLIDGFSFWNQNAGGPGPMGATGIQGVMVSGSTDGVIFSAIAGAPTVFARQTSGAAVPPEAFSFAAVSVTHLRFDIGSNWGDASQTGFAEVQFSAVPAPGAGALVAAIGLVAAARRRR